MKRPRRQSRMICTSNTHTYTHTHSARQRPLPSVNGHRSTFILSFLKFTDEEGRTAISWLSNDPPPHPKKTPKTIPRSTCCPDTPRKKKVYNGIVAVVMFCFGWFSMNSMILLYPSAVHGLQVSNMNSLRRAQGRNQFVFCLFLKSINLVFF